MPIVYYQHKRTRNIVYAINRDKNLIRVRYPQSGYTTWFTIDYFHEIFRKVG